jgi:O-acetylhomoserine (thiol)-lyase
METTCIQGGWQPKNGEPRILPIYQSTTFKYSTSEQMGRLFDLEENGYFYTRLANPTNDAVADKIRELEGGAAAMLTSSDRRQTFMRYLISAARAIIWSARQPYTAAHQTCLSLR